MPLNGVSQVFQQKFLFYSKTPWSFFTNNNWQIFIEKKLVKSCGEKDTFSPFWADILVKSVENVSFVSTDQNFVISWCQKWPWSREIVITWFHGASTMQDHYSAVLQQQPDGTCQCFLLITWDGISKTKSSRAHIRNMTFLAKKFHA